MSTHVTPRKRAFAIAYAESGSVVDAARVSGYSNASGCYKFVRTDDDGRYLDPVIGGLIAQYQREPAPIVELDARRKQDDQPAELTISTIHARLWEMGEDTGQPAGARVQALNILLKDLRDSAPPVVISDEEILDAVRAKLAVPLVAKR